MCEWGDEFEIGVLILGSLEQLWTGISGFHLFQLSAKSDWLIFIRRPCLSCFEGCSWGWIRLKLMFFHLIIVDNLTGMQRELYWHVCTVQICVSAFSPLGQESDPSWFIIERWFIHSVHRHFPRCIYVCMCSTSLLYVQHRTIVSIRHKYVQQLWQISIPNTQSHMVCTALTYLGT